MSYPTEIAYLNSPNWELPNFVWLMEPYWNRNVDPSRSPCLKIVYRKRIKRRDSKFRECATHSLGKTVLHTSSDLFKPVQTFSHLFTPVPTCSHLFTSQWLPTLFMQWQFLIEFSPCESCYFSILRPILLKFHIFAHLIKSFPMVYGLCSCIEIKMSIPLAAHT